MTFGEKLRRLREQRQLKLRELAELCQISPGHLSQLENEHKGNPGLEIMRRLAETLGVSISELVTEETPEPLAAQPELPAALQEFVDAARVRGQPLAPEDVRMLAGIKYRGDRPASARDYEELLEIIKLKVRKP